MQKLPFIPGQEYHRRSQLHALYGGNWQGGICPSKDHPFIFIFSGKSGQQYGYEDGWDNPNIYTYTGEGQKGDMEFTRGNLALRDHLANGKRVFLFEYQRKGWVRFVSEVEVFDADYFEAFDTNGRTRVGIKFFFKRAGVDIGIGSELITQPSKELVTYENYGFQRPNETERKGLVTTRVGQGAYRKRIIHRWEYKCAVTGFDKLNVLIASHIVPWADATSNERLDVHNGLLLSPTYDALFDKHLISFEDSGKIILSDKIESDAYQKIGVSGKEKITNLSQYNHDYLDRHRNNLI